VLDRRPELALVDELAHANLPGERHAKRWHDVGELLDNGIDVYTTLNVANIQSLGALVSRVTGVHPAEPVPRVPAGWRDQARRPSACGASPSARPGPRCSARAGRCGIVELFPLRESRCPAGTRAAVAG
jgi:Osmosensitive K+ channel His kinase sensor domain